MKSIAARDIHVHMVPGGRARAANEDYSRKFETGKARRIWKVPLPRRIRLVDTACCFLSCDFFAI